MSVHVHVFPRSLGARVCGLAPPPPPDQLQASAKRATALLEEGFGDAITHVVRRDEAIGLGI